MIDGKINSFQNHLPANLIRRIAAFMINFLLLGAASLFFEKLELCCSEVFDIYILGLTSTIIFCCLPESPGKRIMDLKILDGAKQEIVFKTRILRASPYIFFFISPVTNLIFQNEKLANFHLALHMLGLFCLIANFTFLSVNRGRLSLMDLISRTQVMMPRYVQSYINR